MNPIKKSIIGSVLGLTSWLIYYNHYSATGTFELFSGASIFLILGSLAIFFDYGKDIGESIYNKSEEEESTDDILERDYQLSRAIDAVKTIAVLN